MQVELTCENCGKDFEIPHWRIKTARFCSRKCSDESRRGEQNVTCCVCGKKFHKKQSHIDKCKNHYCSYGCHKIAKEQYMLGENNHQYGLKGDLNSSHKSDFSVSNYGYLMVKSYNHPFRIVSSNCVFFHRMIMEEYLRENEPASEYLIDVSGGEIKYLDPQVCVHHIDGNKLNNRISNLEIMEYGDHVALHSQDMVYERDEFNRWSTVFSIKSKTDYTGISKGKTYDAGQDLHAYGDYIISEGESCLINTGLKLAIPRGHVGFIWSRSGLAVKNNIECGAGCIDSEYRGEIKVLLRNLGNEPFNIEDGDRIAQIVILPVRLKESVEGELPESIQRDSDGFGSTGL